MPLVIARLPTGSMVDLDANSADTVADLKLKLWDKAPEAHPALVRLSLGGTELRDGRTLASYDVQKEATFNVRLRPASTAMEINVGGIKYITTLETLLARPRSRLYEIFADVLQGGKPCYPTSTVERDGIAEGVPLSEAGGSMLVAGPLPQHDGIWFLDRNGPSFAYVLDFLRTGDVALPTDPQQIRQVAIEARYYGLGELAQLCDAVPGAVAVTSLRTLAAACGGGTTATDIAKLTDAEATEVLREHRVGLMVAKAIWREVAVERERVEVEAKEQAALAEAERSLQTLAAALTQADCHVSDAGVRLLNAAGLGMAELWGMDVASVQRSVPGLTMADAHLVGALKRPGVSEHALTFVHNHKYMLGQGTNICASNKRDATCRHAVCGEALDTSAGPVFWKVTLIESRPDDVYVCLGVIANTQPDNDGSQSRQDPTSFGWSNNRQVFIAGKNQSGHGGWQKWLGGDVVVFKLEKQQLSMRVKRLGDQTFTMPTNGVGNLHVHVWSYYTPTRVQLSQAEPQEEY